MKKFTLLSLMLVLCVSLFAQNTPMNVGKNIPLTTPKAAKPVLNTPKAIIWQNDFSVPGNWTIAHNAGTTGDWVIGTTGPAGTYAISTIASTTAANGFAKFDSDFIGGGNQIGNLTTATSFSCTGHAAVALTFQQYYRQWYDSTYVYVSNNGTTWTKFTVNKTLAPDAFSGGNPTLTSVNISSVAANQATVWIRFTYYGPSSLGINSGGGYAWMVDDVKVIDLVANDITAYKSFLDLDGSGTGAGYYEVIPLNQMGTVRFGESAINSGSAAQTNVMLNVNINNGAITANSTAIASLASNASATLWAQPTITAPAIATLYEAKLSVSQTQTDANPADNIGDSMTFIAYPNYFSRTQDFDSYLTPYSFGASAPAITGMEYGANYKFNNADRVDSISVIVYKNVGNTSITAKLYTVTGVGVHTLVGSSAAHNITAADNLPSYIKLGLTTPYSVAAGTVLCATVAMTVNIANHDTVFIGSDDGFIADAAVAGAAYLRVGTTWGWYTITGTVPIANLVLYDPTTGINEANTNEKFHIYPNPASDILNIVSDFTIQNIRIFDNLGQVVMEKTFKGKSASININELQKGLYFVELVGENTIVTQKFIISK